ncbi:MAG: M20/M25/M40 family metallo-hydrolase [Planctomycetota bacterium]
MKLVHYRRQGLYAAFLTLLVWQGPPSAYAVENNATVEARMLGDVSYLASDSLEGRGIDNPGIIKASEYIRDRFQEAGLKPGGNEGSYFQPFTVRLSSEVDFPNTRLVLHGPDNKDLKLELNKDFSPLTYGGDGSFNLPIVFAGYGITAEAEKYDDYANLDVTGKVVLILRREPQQAKADSVFAGTGESQYAALQYKLQNAWTHKAAAVLLVTDPFTTKETPEKLFVDAVASLMRGKAAPPAKGLDRLLPTNYMGHNSTVSMPVAHITQAVANQLLAGSPAKSVQLAEAVIDKNLQPASCALDGWTAEGELHFTRVNADLVNVVGVIEGEGPHADETVVIGAHYDHLGRGGEGSLAPDSKDVHNGADDNASGTATLIELARRFGEREKKPGRRLVFIAFSAEEKGLLGSRHYVKKAPLFPLDKTVAMVNFDMVGRMKNNKLTIYGTKSAKDLEAIIDGEKSAEDDLDIKKIGSASGLGGSSDHASFVMARVPAVHFFTGTHPDYHRPSDDVDKINVEGMRRVADFAAKFIDRVIERPNRFEFVKSEESDPHAGMDLPAGGRKTYLGTVPDYGEEVEGVLLNDVKKDSPADKAGLKAGDVIVEIDGAPIKNVQGFTVILYQHKPGDSIEITVLRNKERVPLKATLGSR